MIEKNTDSTAERDAMRQVAMLLTESEVERLEEIQKDMGLRSRNELIRHLIVTHPTYRNGFQHP